MKQLREKQMMIMESIYGNNQPSSLSRFFLKVDETVVSGSYDLAIGAFANGRNLLEKLAEGFTIAYDILSSESGGEPRRKPIH